MGKKVNSLLNDLAGVIPYDKIEAFFKEHLK